MAEYRHSAHAVFDLKYHVVWITKYRYKILRGGVAERARELIRQICAAREVTIIRGAVSPDHIHMLVAAPPQSAPAKLVQFIKGRSSRMCSRSSPRCANGTGGNSCGRGAISARVSARSTRRRSVSISRTNVGTTMSKDSKSQRRPSLEPALSRRLFRRLEPQADFQSAKESTAFRR